MTEKLFFAFHMERDLWNRILKHLGPDATVERLEKFVLEAAEVRLKLEPPYQSPEQQMAPDGSYL